jgi:DNA-binding NtrC family response regulator
MTFHSGNQPAIALVDDDYHSARLLTRMLEAHGGPQVRGFSDTAAARDFLVEVSMRPANDAQCMAIVDIKSTSTATRDFIARLKLDAPGLLVIAMAPSLDRETRNGLLNAGAAAVFERHADIELYRREAANIVAFWVRNQRLDAVGT